MPCWKEKDPLERDGRQAWGWWCEMISSPNKNSVACITDGKNQCDCLSLYMLSIYIYITIVYVERR